MTDQEKDLIENLEHNGFYNTALSLRKFLATQNRNANAGCENPGADLFAGNTAITPEQARYAFANALEGPPRDPWYTTPKVVFWRGIDGDLCKSTLIGFKSAWQKLPKHHFITLSGTPRREPCCL